VIGFPCISHLTIVLQFDLASAMKAMKGVNPLSLWVDGFKQELVKYAVITAQKPA